MEQIDEIIGYKAEKERVEGIADILNNYEKYKEKGVRIPKGLLLSGPAGVGKTLFAHYIAKITKAKFFNFTPTRGRGAAMENAHKIKMLFEEAKKCTPCIIFVDEINNFLPSVNFTSDRNSDFLSTLLKALDGDGYEGILFIGACLDADDLPYPLLRSGRMDEHIVFDYPDCSTRAKIIEYYFSKIDLKLGFNSKALAYKTNGFVGADFKNLCNMASRIAIRRGQNEVQMEDVLDAIYTIKFKDIKRGKADDDKLEVAVHEVGHLVVGKILLSRSYDVTIDGYDYVDGITLPNDEDDDDDYDDDDYVLSMRKEKQYYNHQIAVSLAGKASTEIFLDKLSDGCRADIDKSLDIAEYMLETGLYGFKYVNLPNSYNKEDWSDKQRRLIEKKIESILNKNYRLARKVLVKNKDLVARLVDELKDKTVLIAEDSNEIFKEFGYES